MSQYTTGTCNVTNGDATVTGTGTEWLANVTSGDEFIVANGSVAYTVASVTNDTELELTVTFSQATANNQSYAIGRDFSVNMGFRLITKGDIETAVSQNTNWLILDALAAGSPPSISFTPVLNLGELQDVSLSGSPALASGDNLVYNGVSWSYSTAVLNLGDLLDVTLTGSPVLTTGDTLIYNGVDWEYGVGGVTDHSLLTNLSADDHTHYLLADGTRNVSRTNATTQLAVDAQSSGSPLGNYNAKLVLDAATISSSTIIDFNLDGNNVGSITQTNGSLSIYTSNYTGSPYGTFTFSILPGLGVLRVQSSLGDYVDNINQDDDIPNKQYVDESVGYDLGEFTVAGLPTASSNANGYALATNASGGRTIVRSDGSNWKVVAVEGATVTT